MSATPPPQTQSVDNDYTSIDPVEDVQLVKQSLRAAIDNSLKFYLYSNAIFYAERLYDIDGNFKNLHTLAHCYHLNQDSSTACRLLQNHYPFFRENLESVLIEISNHHEVEEHYLQNIADRWSCQYLFGVCCYQAKRYSDGEKILLELIQISIDISNFAKHGSVHVSATFRSEGMVQRENNNSYGRTAGGVHRNNTNAPFIYCDPQHPLSLFQYRDRLAEIYHWLGMCQQHHNVDRATESFYTSVNKNGLIFASFDKYIKTASRPLPNCVAQLFQTSKPSPWPLLTNDAPKSEASADASIAEKRSVTLLRYVVPFAKAIFLLRVYRIDDIKNLVTNPLFPCSNFATRTKHSNSNNSGAPYAATPAAVTVTTRPSVWQLTHLALAQFHEGNMLASANTFAQLLSYNPWYLQDSALVYYSTALWHLKDRITLGALSQQLLEELPFAATTLAVVANAYSLAKEPREAIIMLERATQVDPMLAYAFALRGYELLYMDHKLEASEAFRQAIHVDRNLYIAYAGHGELHYRQEEIEYARQYFRRAISINPSPAIMNRYAATFSRRDATKEDLQQSLAIYEKAIAIHGQNFPALHQHADVLLRLGHLEEAERELLQLAQNSEEAMVFVTLARCQECLGRPNEAIKYYHRAMLLDPRREVYIKGCMERLAAGDEE